MTVRVGDRWGLRQYHNPELFGFEVFNSAGAFLEKHGLAYSQTLFATRKQAVEALEIALAEHDGEWVAEGTVG